MSILTMAILSVYGCQRSNDLDTDAGPDAIANDDSGGADDDAAVADDDSTTFDDDASGDGPEYVATVDVGGDAFSYEERTTLTRMRILPVGDADGCMENWQLSTGSRPGYSISVSFHEAPAVGVGVDLGVSIRPDWPVYARLRYTDLDTGLVYGITDGWAEVTVLEGPIFRLDFSDATRCSIPELSEGTDVSDCTEGWSGWYEFEEAHGWDITLDFSGCYDNVQVPPEDGSPYWCRDNGGVYECP